MMSGCAAALAVLRPGPEFLDLCLVTGVAPLACSAATSASAESSSVSGLSCKYSSNFFRAFFPVVARDADQSGAGAPRPSHNKNSMQQFVDCRDPRLRRRVPSAIRDQVVVGITIGAHGQSDCGIMFVADGKNQCIDIEGCGAVRRFCLGAAVLAEEQDYSP